MAPSFLNRIWARFTRARIDSRLSHSTDLEEKDPITQDNLALQYDLEVAIQADTSIRNAREIFDPDLIEPQPPNALTLSSTQQPHPSPIAPLPFAIEVSPDDIDTIPPNSLVTETDDSLLNSFFEFLHDIQPESQPTADLSTLISFALPFEPAIPPQLSKQGPKARGRVSLAERSLARASKLGETFCLSNEEIRTLAKILKRYRLHHKVLTELESLLLSGYAPDELLTAHKIRKIWRRSEYCRTTLLQQHKNTLQLSPAVDSPYAAASDCLEKRYKRGEGTIFTTSLSIPSWRQAASWARLLGNISSAELDSLLYWYYERWLEKPPIWITRPSFVMHVDYSIRTVAHDLHDCIPWELGFEHLPLDDYHEH